MTSNFIRSTLIILLVFTTGFGIETDETATERPNVLFIICDDLNDSVEGMGGHPQARTPNIDKLASEGVRFENAHCAAPLCGPSRASLWTGIYPHHSGIYGYNQSKYTWRDSPVLKNAVTVFEHFAAHGYKVFTTGKVTHNNHHLAKMIWELSGKDAFASNSTFGPFAYDGRDRVVHPSMKLPWGINRYETFAPLSNIPETLPDPERGIPGYKGWWLYNKPFRYKGPDDRDLMPDERSAEWAREKLSIKHDEPFFLAVGFMRPHTPWIAPDEFFQQHPLDSIQLPPYLEGDTEDCGPLSPDRFEANHERMNRFRRLLEAYPDKEGWKKAVQGYLACVSFVDHQIGKVLQALEESDYADNTIVILISDHGFHIGEKSHLHKNTIWEESTRVPLIIRLPGNEENSNRKCLHPVSLIDLYPTLIDICRLPSEPNKGKSASKLDGQSLANFIMDPSTQAGDFRRVALTAVAGFSQVDIGELAPVDEQHYTVRSRDFRYVLWADGFEELYDHRNDPHEWYNLADRSDYQQIKLDLSKKMNQLVRLSRD
jgi:arylsulfatase A-like enzyme